MTRDARYARDHYGGELEMRRRSMEAFGQKIQVDTVDLIYDAEGMPDPEIVKPIINEIREKLGVEVLFQ